MIPDMIKQLRELQKENARLRKVVSDQAIDMGDRQGVKIVGCL
jgi:hypothetical protein